MRSAERLCVNSPPSRAEVYKLEGEAPTSRPETTMAAGDRCRKFKQGIYISTKRSSGFCRGFFCGGQHPWISCFVRELFFRFCCKVVMTTGMLAVEAETEHKGKGAKTGFVRFALGKVSIDLPNPARGWIREITGGLHKTPLRLLRSFSKGRARTVRLP